MSIKFGKVKKYIQHRGFGFVACCFSESKQAEVFFHIKTIKKSNYEIFEKLENNNYDNLYFWYEIETKNKGVQIKRVLNTDDERIKNNPNFVEILERKWLEISSDLPDWVEFASESVFDDERISELKNKRNLLRQEEKQKRIEHENARQAEYERARIARERELQKQRELREIQEREFEQLVDEVQGLGFTHSNKVSDYIKRNRLGDKYKHLAGILEMHRGTDTWHFDGGINPRFYARLCSELRLQNQGTDSVPGRFISYNDLNN